MSRTGRMKNEVLCRVRRWIGPVMLALAISGVSSQSRVPGPEIPHFDKLAHFAVFGLLATLLHRAGAPHWKSWVSVLVVSAYGAIDEWHQYFVPGRSTELADWIMDTLGAALAVALYVHWAWYRRWLEFPLKRQRRIEKMADATPNVPA